MCQEQTSPQRFSLRQLLRNYAGIFDEKLRDGAVEMTQSYSSPSIKTMILKRRRKSVSSER